MTQETQLDLFVEPAKDEKDRPVYKCFVCEEWHTGDCDVEVIKRLLEQSVDSSFEQL